MAASIRKTPSEIRLEKLERYTARVRQLVESAKAWVDLPDGEPETKAAAVLLMQLQTILATEVIEAYAETSVELGLATVLRSMSGIAFTQEQQQ